MHSGTISNNTAEQNGGGVQVNGGGSFTLNGGNISDNTAEKNGGGVGVDAGSFSMNFGFIQGNQVSGKNGNGGGVYVGNGTFSMTAGSINGNGIYFGGRDDDGTGRGCGVYVESGGTFRKTGGTIPGLVNEEMNAWEGTDGQNYYRYLVNNQNNESFEDDPKNEYYEYGYHEELIGRGYAVYYDHDEGGESIDGDWWRDITAGAECKLDTESEDMDDWNGEYWPSEG
jgi:hypothetical protein